MAAVSGRPVDIYVGGEAGIVTIGNKSDDQILTSRSGKVAHIIFNNPARHNAMNLFMWQRLAELMNELASDDDTRVVVLSGAGGKAFVSGADISQFESERSSADRSSPVLLDGSERSD